MAKINEMKRRKAFEAANVLLKSARLKLQKLSQIWNAFQNELHRCLKHACIECIKQKNQKRLNNKNSKTPSSFSFSFHESLGSSVLEARFLLMLIMAPSFF